MGIIQKLVKKPLWVNVLVGIGGLLLVFIILFFSLGLLTGNGKKEKVPNVVGLDVNTATHNLTALGFKVVVQDSIFVDSLAHDAVLRQSPEVDEIVKQGRTIYLTINRVLAPQIEMPNLVGFSLQSATTYLKVLGLRVGSTSYQADRNTDVILDQLLNGAHIEPGAKIPSGTVINLIVGDGALSTLVEVPDVLGFNVESAKTILETAGFKIGNFNSSEIIQDTATAFVIAQDPNPFLLKIDTATNLPIKNRVPLRTPIHLTIGLTQPIRPLTDTIQ
jgi:beta-lactam-binding protein with PASTA domain